MKSHDPHPLEPEFSRPLIVDRVPKLGSMEKIAAEPAELKALAVRLGLPALHALKADIRATPWRGGGMKLDGTITADIDQVSVVSLETFRQTVEVPLLRYFLPQGSVAPTDGDDADPIEHGIIDLGEVTAETLALELEPYPRRPGESFQDMVEAEEAQPERESPFSALSKLTKS